MSIKELQKECHSRSVKAGWYTDLATGLPKEVNKAEKLMLVVSELSECMEGIRKNLMDDKLPHRTMEEAELADAVIRIMDYAGYRNLDLEGAIFEKLEYNDNREDHKLEHRMNHSNGKQF
jgi:NTP pyrophosphatase (non-canonical NTP hydrolase)